MLYAKNNISKTYNESIIDYYIEPISSPSNASRKKKNTNNNSKVRNNGFRSFLYKVNNTITKRNHKKNLRKQNAKKKVVGLKPTPKLTINSYRNKIKNFNLRTEYQKKALQKPFFKIFLHFKVKKQKIKKEDISLPLCLTEEQIKKMDSIIKNEILSKVTNNFSIDKNISKPTKKIKNKKKVSMNNNNQDMFSYKFDLQPEIDFPKSNTLKKKNNPIKNKTINIDENDKSTSIIDLFNHDILTERDISKNKKLKRISLKIESQYKMLNEIENSLLTPKSQVVNKKNIHNC